MALRRRLLSLDCHGGGDDDLCHNSPPPPTTTFYVFPSPHSAGIPHSMKKIIPISASLLAFAFILFSYYMACHWYPTLRRRRLPRFIAPPALPPPQLAAAAPDPREDLLAIVADGGEPYHVWLIKTKGLDEKTIGAISVCTYKKEGVVEGSDCTICLGEFVEGESLRVLPNCSHAFHLPCIDTWLRSHVNCPLCRAPVVSPPCVKGEEASNSLDHVVQLPVAPDPAHEVVRAGSSSSNTEPEVRVTIEPPNLEDRTTRVKLETLRRSVSVDSGFRFMSRISGRACGL